MIDTHQLTKRYGGTTVVDRLDLQVAERGIVGFLGPNGAGKTTTMRMLTGFLPMTEGTAVVCGFDVFEKPHEVKARVGYLPETLPLYPELTVGEYLTYAAEIRGVPRARRLSRVGEVMEQVGLQGWERRLTGSLSKGFRQRVGLAQAIVHEPRLLILDEPTSGLDPAQVVGVRDLMRRLSQDRVVVLSTHVLAEVERLCERVVLLHRGRIVGDGTANELAERAGAPPWIELALDEESDVSRDLSTLPSCDSVAPDGAGGYALRGGPNLASDVVALAGARGWRICALTPRRSSLEEVFLAIVGAES